MDRRKPFFEIFAAVWMLSALIYVHTYMITPAVKSGFCRQICGSSIHTTFTLTALLVVILTVFLSREKRISRGLITLAVPLAAVGDSQILMSQSVTGSILFTAAIISMIAGSFFSDGGNKSELHTPWFKWTPQKAWILFSILFVITLFIKFYKFGYAIEGLAYDEAVKGYVAIEILEGQQQFRPYFQYRESFFFYLIALSFKYFGVSLTAMRITTTAVTTSALFLMYYYLKTWFSREIAFVSSLFMAVSLWHSSFSRMTQRPVLVILVQILIMIIVTGIYRKRRWWQYPVLGLCVGIGFYTYPPIKFFYLSLIPVFLYIYIRDRKSLLKHLPGVIIAGALILAMLMIPLGRHALEFPDYFFSSDKLGYKNTRSIDTQGGFTNNAFMALKTWHKRPAPGGTTRPANGNFPLLDPIVGIFFIAGLGVVMVRIRKFEYFFLIMAFLSGLLPGFIVYPFQRRLITATFLVYPMAGMGFVYFWEQLRRASRHRDRMHRALPYIIAASLFFPMYTGWGILQDKLYNSDITYRRYMSMEYAAELYQKGYIINFIGKLAIPMYRFALYDEHEGYTGTGLSRIFFGNKVRIPFNINVERNIAYVLTFNPAGSYPQDKEDKILKYYPHAVKEEHFRKGKLIFTSFLISNKDAEAVWSRPLSQPLPSKAGER